MSKQYDAATKHLVESIPTDWMGWVGVSSEEDVKMIDADVSTVTAGADKVILVGSPPRCLVHIELQANREERLAERLLK